MPAEFKERWHSSESQHLVIDNQKANIGGH
jgi:hypothetical protein